MLVYSENAYYNLIRFDGSVHLVLRGNYAMKRRQLRHLGFRIIEVYKRYQTFNECSTAYNGCLLMCNQSKIIPRQLPMTICHDRMSDTDISFFHSKRDVAPW